MRRIEKAAFNPKRYPMAHWELISGSGRQRRGVIRLWGIVALDSSLSLGIAPDFSLIDQHIHQGLDSAVFDPRDDLRLFLATGDYRPHHGSRPSVSPSAMQAA